MLDQAILKTNLYILFHKGGVSCGMSKVIVYDSTLPNSLFLHVNWLYMSA